MNQARCDHVVLIDDARLFLAPSPAPHRYDQWPDLLHVASALAEGRFSRYAAVFEDVTRAYSAAAVSRGTVWPNGGEQDRRITVRDIEAVREARLVLATCPTIGSRNVIIPEGWVRLANCWELEWPR